MSKQKNKPEFPYHISRFIVEMFTRLVSCVSVHGKHHVPKAPYLAASNHISYLDPPLVGMVCKKSAVAFMAKRELFNHKKMGWWFSAVNCIPVDRGASSVGSLREAVRRLKDGKVVAIFPEGTRSEDGAIQEAKRGTGFLIAKAGVPVLPIYIHGTDKALPKKGKLKTGQRVHVIIGKPIMPEEFKECEKYGKESYAEMANLVMSRIADIKKANQSRIHPKKS